MPTNVGTRIKELRIMSGMSQEELGRRIGVQRAAIQKYETGAVINIPLHTIEKLANIFEVSPNYIVGWVDASNQIAAEVKLLQGLSNIYGSDTVDLLEEYVTLTTMGKQRVQQYIHDIHGVYKQDS